MNALAPALVLVLAAASASACPAAWVQEVGRKNLANPTHELARRVTDEYLAGRGIPPRSPAGEVIAPYVLGTTIFDHESRLHRLDGKSVEVAVIESLACPHHQEHFGDGRKAVEEGSAVPVPVEVRGG